MRNVRTRRIGREALAFLGVFGVCLVLLPVLLAALAFQSRQAMFFPAYKSLYTYFFEYTVAVCLGVAAVFVTVRLIILRLRRR